MRDIRTWQCVLACALIGILLFASINTIVASSGSGYAIDWFEINSGATLTGNDFRLTGVVGQADVDVLSGGSYKLGGGFFTHPGGQDFYRIFLPLVLRSS